MKKIGLIIGFGSIGQKHLQAMKRSKKFKKIYILSNHLIKKHNCIKNFDQIININPDLIVICSETSSHLNQLKFLEKNFKNKIILVEKPIFSKSSNFKIKKNNVYVAYNLRYDPMLKHLKKFVSNKKIFNTDISCNSYLPNWRHRDYSKLYSSFKKKGGGVHLDLSHEIDYANWIFGKLKRRNITLKKISNLKINSYDYMFFQGSSNFSKMININLNYFSVKNQRNIEIFTENEVILIDLLARQINFVSLNNIRVKKFKPISATNRMIFQIKDILKKKPQHACSYESGLKVLKILGI
jgi:CMP-N,N'-diacetyllegionaminic acid synthase